MVTTNGGLNLLRDVLAGTNTTLDYIAIGSSSSVAKVDDTTLGSEVNRVSVQSFREYNTGVTGDVGVFKKRARLLSTKRNAFTEVGLLTAESGGTLFNRIVTSSISHTAGREIRIDMEYQIRKP